MIKEPIYTTEKDTYTLLQKLNELETKVDSLQGIDDSQVNELKKDINDLQNQILNLAQNEIFDLRIETIL